MQGMNGPPEGLSKKSLKVAIILNGISFQKKYFYQKLLPIITGIAHAEVFETRTKNDAIAQASKAVAKRFDLILAAGGDGTLNQVLNGMLRNYDGSSTLPVLGVLPLGSGNDFARTLGLTNKPSQVATLLQQFTPEVLDIGKIYFQNAEKERVRYFINIADAGMGPSVVKRINASDRVFGSWVAYYSAILLNFFTYQPIEVTINTDRWNWRGKIRTFAVANGKYFGHGLCIAPNAKVHDGLFETFLCGDVSVFDFIRYSGTLKKGNKVNHAKVAYEQVSYVELASTEGGLLEADGELMGELPVRIEMMAGAVRFLF